ncbi:MAG: tetratricopeptide repeat protein [Thermoanaerobaculia bacterium]
MSKLARGRPIVLVKAAEEADATISIQVYRKGPRQSFDRLTVTTHADVGGEALGPFAASGERGAAVELATTRLVEALWVLFDPSSLSDGAIGSLPGFEHRKPSEVKGHLLDAAVSEGRKGNWRESTELWKRYLTLVPDDDLAYYNLGLTLLRWEHWQDAKEAFLRSIELNYSNDLAHYNLGSCYYHLGENRQARRSLEAALKMNPELELAKELLKRIAKKK